jgi:predicted flavoprotein YhiN
MIAAWRAASLGASVVLLERNRKPGIKLLISGGGKCNITHAGGMEDLRSAFRPREARFLKHSFHCFTNDDIVRLIEAERVPTFARTNGRVFPVSEKANDVVDAMLAALRGAGAHIELDARVESLKAADGVMQSTTVRGEERSSSHIVLATGGVSWRRREPTWRSGTTRSSACPGVWSLPDLRNRGCAPARSLRGSRPFAPS